MILKNKIIFGTIGFLAAGGVTALTIVIATSDDESQAKGKTKLDVPKLTSNSFEMSGTQTLGVVNLKSDMILVKEVELKYFVGSDAPINDNNYTTNKPSNLKNGDIVYVKPFIKKASIKNYEFKAKVNPIKFVVSNLPLTSISSSFLTKDSFVISGAQTQGTIKKKFGVTLPSEVEIKYAISNSEPISDSAYSSISPTNLSNNDIVYIKFFIKSEFVLAHKLPTSGFDNPVKFIVKDLKTLIDHRALQKSSFEVTGTQGKGTIGWKVNARELVLPSQVEIRYYKGAIKPSGDSGYKTIPSLALSNNDLVHIKFFIKEEHTKTYEFASDFSNYILFEVRDLDKNEVDTTSLVSNSFQATGVQGTGTMELKDDVTLPSEVEAKYYKGTIQPSSENSYQTSFLLALSNGEKVYIKFFIKSEFVVTHKLPTNFTNPVLFKVSNLIVNNGRNVFQDSSGNIWAMGDVTPLRVLVKKEDGNYADSWISDPTQPGLLRKSKINKGTGGVIFEDSHGNIWATGLWTPLQVLKKEGVGFANSWISDPTQPGLLSGSNITNGDNGVIFEDSSGNLWAMGSETPLQVLKKEGSGFASSWISDHTQEGLLNGSNITDGYAGTIFEDSYGNIWAMGKGTLLQVLKKEGSGFASSWISDSTQAGLLKDSNITNGFAGTIFEDSSGNIWAMGDETPLQVLKKEGSGFASSWISDSTQAGLLKDSNITNGFAGTIFEDSSGNIWAMGNETPLQVLKKEGSGFASSWISDSTQAGLLKDSNITNGFGGTIFEDSSGNIWAMANEVKLQVLVKNRDGNYANAWISDNSQEGLLKDSNIDDGYEGVIFEDSSGNIWAMGYEKPVQVLRKEGNGFAGNWNNF